MNSIDLYQEEFYRTQLTMLIAYGVGLTAFILFLVTQQKVLRAIPAVNRALRPGLVWLQLIPLFGLLWQFVVVIRTADSIKKTQLPDDPDGQPGEKPSTLTIGRSYCIVNTAFVSAFFICGSIPRTGQWNLHKTIWGGYYSDFLQEMVIPLLLLSAAIICWVSYWVRLSRIRHQLTLHAVV